MRSVSSISVLMPTWQGIEFLERALSALASQRVDLPWDFLAIDSGSSDGTWELLGRLAPGFPVPLRRQRIDKVEFDHGDTRNLLAAESRGELLVYLTQDAIPVGEDWLQRLADNFSDEEVGAAYCRNVPRPDAERLTKIFSAKDPGYTEGRRETRLPEPALYAKLDPHAKRLLYNFNDVASAVRRDLWERHPFPRTPFGEDVLMARALLEAGYSVVYDDRAEVEHSHDYTTAETRARARIDGEFNAEWLGRICVASRSDARTLVKRTLEEDRAALAASGLAPAEQKAELARAEELREATFLGLWEGGRSKQRRPPSCLLDETRLKILYVIHGFPPDTWAGTEVYTLNLAKEMQARGHATAILTRAPAAKSEAEGGPPDFSLSEDEFEGLRVLRMTHRLEHKSMRESYDQPRAEQCFRRVLLEEAPDLVHFQHLIHSSAGLVQVAKELGLATVITCHDYWAICARVQLIRPDGERCEENMGSGCFLCVKERGLKHVRRLKRVDRLAGPVLDALAGGSRHGRQLSDRGRRRWEGFADIRARQEFVVAAYAAADLRISPSRFLRQKLVDTAGFAAHTFLYSDNGMRTDHVRALEKEPDPEGRVRFGFVGSLVWYKGGEVMVRAMNRLADEKAVLNVYGDFSPENDAHHAQLQALATAGNVHFKGRFDNARLSDVYAEIDVLVVPSTWFENSPITIHEAFLTRTPVLASDIGGMAEFVRDGVDGLHFIVGDDADLAAKMRRFLREPGLLEELSEDWIPIKTITQNAAEMEFRYRALAARALAGARHPSSGAGAHLLLDYSGIDACKREEPCVQQGADMLLALPGGALEYSLEGAGGGPRRIELDLFALGGESETELGGRVLIDGGEEARIPLFRAGVQDELRTVELELDLARGARRLRLETSIEAGGPAAHLRVKSVRVSRIGVTAKATREASA